MPVLRSMLSALVAIAIVLAPIVSAWATVKKSTGAQVALENGDAAEHKMGFAATQMKDCASSMKGSSSTDDCPLCGNDKACPPELCLAKCFQLFSIDRPVASLARFGSAQFRPTESKPPPDWSKKPQPPPPRT